MAAHEYRHSRLLSIVAAAILLASLLPRLAYAESSSPSDQGLLWSGVTPLTPAVAQQAEGILYSSETGFAIEEARFADYFSRRGRVKTFGFPTSRTFLFLGLPTQFFQRSVLQLGADGAVRSLNLLDPGLLSYTRINGSAFPATDERLAAMAPTPGRPNYATAIVDFVRQHAPETFNGQPVRFFTTFNTSVGLSEAFPSGGGDANLLPLINLEIWGVPTSAPAQDPNNGNFIYQRFQRGIMHYDAGCRCTQGLLLADHFKALITGEGLPSDLEEQAQGSPFLRQYSTGRPNGLSRPAALPNTDLRDAFARQSPPAAASAPVAASAPSPAAAAAPPAPAQATIRVDQGLFSAIDALEAADKLLMLNVIAQTDTEITFGDLPEHVHARYSRIGRGPRQPPTRTIVVNNRWRNSDPKALATIIAHEAKHLEDDLAGADVRTPEGCFNFEFRAFTEQALIWQGYYGRDGKARPQDDLDVELNSWLEAHQKGPAELEQRVRQLYSKACVITPT